MQKEIKDAIFSSYAKGALGPDGLPFLFYKKIWEILNTDVVICSMTSIKVFWTFIS